MNKDKKYQLSAALIQKAVDGDTLAIYEIVKHYEGYMIILSTRRFYDEAGVLHYRVDETLKGILEIKLVTKILEFKIM